MKYWSSSRVGAVPQATPTHPPQDNKKEKGGGTASRFNRKKGITMEDLKKQTAIRLAQEQHQPPKGRSAGGGGAAAPRTPETPSRSGHSAGSGDPPKAANLGRSPAPSGPAASSPANRGSSGPRRSREAPSSSPVVAAGEGSYSIPPTVPAPFYGGVAESPVPPPASSYEASLFPPPSLEPSHVASGSIPSFAPSTGVMVNPTELASRATTISMHSSSSSSESMSKRKKSKLPHGLTVQELKEMTKARLQAEAAEKTGAASSVAGASGSGMPGLHHPDPSSVMRDNASPVPPAFLHRPRPHSSRGDAWSSHDSRSEAWETGSVSTVASEYLGSESAYGMGSFGGPEDPSPSPYGRPPMGSGMGGPVHAFSDHPPSDVVMFSSGMAPPSAYNYDAGSGPGNRRRAATLSPRVGLSYLDESREVFPDHDATPMLPTFASPSAHCHFPMRSRSGYGPDRCANGTNYRLGSSPMEFNRPRTSSATSLPPISHTSEEFSIDQSPFRRGPANTGLGSLAVSRDMAPSPSVTGLADAFQDSSPFVSPPPGLAGFDLHQGVAPSTNFGVPSRLASENFLGAAAAGSPPPADPRGRASTWGGATSLDSLFGPSLIEGSGAGRDVGHLRELQLHQQHQQRAQDSLCDDLESILKLNVGPSDHLFPPPGL